MAAKIKKLTKGNKGAKKCAIKRKLKFKDQKNSFQLENKINQLEKLRLIQKFIQKTIMNS